MEVVDILKAAREHISDPAMWFKGDMSLEQSEGAMAGLPCCAWGALIWAAQKMRVSDSPVYSALIDALPDGYFCLGIFNDDPTTTHADILALFDRAIAEASK